MFHSIEVLVAKAAESKLEVFTRGRSQLEFECFRSGVDGRYVIQRVAHEVGDGGYSCRMECESKL
ncbi:hypothetical protein [Algicola sagamiensis]|uniref:hypothetical protein n=1 Tax=Algicola sagamiensis TaxID=163869 RepID=UPI00037A09F5|nr:hypothetical protein [Algicola sagamiensis]